MKAITVEMQTSRASVNRLRRTIGFAVSSALRVAVLIAALGAADANANTWAVLSGDWNGDGVDTAGLYNRTSSRFFLTNSHSGGGSDRIFTFGQTGWLPVAGDWDGDGVDTIGVYNPSTGRFFLRNANSRGPSDLTFVLNTLIGVPLAGDWNGNGVDGVGVYHPASARFGLRNGLSDGPPSLKFQYGQANWLPVVGDWNGNGVDSIGVYNGQSGRFFLRNSNSSGPSDHHFLTDDAGPGRYPMSGDWNGASGGFQSGVGNFAPTTFVVRLQSGLEGAPTDYMYRFKLGSAPGGVLYQSDFSKPDISDWVLVDASGDPTDWLVLNEELYQLNPTSRTVHGDEIYVTGNYAYLSPGLGFTDYRVRIDVRPRTTDPEQVGSDLGLLFRYKDTDNYYRVALNSKFGYTELIKRQNGRFTTLSVDNRGYESNRPMTLGVEVIGNIIKVYLADASSSVDVFDQPPLFGVRDTTHAQGSIALYTQSKASFDNVQVETPSIAPKIAIADPVSFGVTSGNALPVSAVVTNPPVNAMVQFEMDDVACDDAVESAPGLFSSRCGLATTGEHEVRARLLQNGTVPLALDRNAPVGTRGAVMLAVGDSITNGVGDRYSTDNVSADIALAGISEGPRMIGLRSYASNLHDLLTESPMFTAPNVVINSGRPGDRSDQTETRLDSVLKRHPEATHVLLLIGINDALSSLAPAPGFGCTGIDCEGTFKGYIQSIIDQSRAAGKLPVLGKITGAFGRHKGTVFSSPGTAKVNVISRNYNAVLSELATQNGLPTGPDFYQFFLESGPSRISLSADNLHPNALGHVAMARLWFNSLTGGAGTPFILRNLCLRVDNAGCSYPSSYTDVKFYRQNMLEQGDPYYIDLGFVLTDVPSTLDQGIWIQTANAHRGNTRSNYLSFDVDRAVDVYVAYDPGPSALPYWLRGYEDTRTTLGVSAPGGRLRLYRRSYAAGSTIQLGGASAPGVVGTVSRNYVAVVRPR